MRHTQKMVLWRAWSVHDGPVTEVEVLAFVQTLPQYRSFNARQCLQPKNGYGSTGNRRCIYWSVRLLCTIQSGIEAHLVKRYIRDTRPSLCIHTGIDTNQWCILLLFWSAWATWSWSSSLIVQHGVSSQPPVVLGQSCIELMHQTGRRASKGKVLNERYCRYVDVILCYYLCCYCATPLLVYDICTVCSMIMLIELILLRCYYNIILYHLLLLRYVLLVMLYVYYLYRYNTS